MYVLSKGKKREKRRRAAATEKPSQEGRKKEQLMEEIRLPWKPCAYKENVLASSYDST